MDKETWKTFALGACSILCTLLGIFYSIHTAQLADLRADVKSINDKLTAVPSRDEVRTIIADRLAEGPQIFSTVGAEGMRRNQPE